MPSRRRFLQSAAALATLPPSIQRALAIEANQATGTLADVGHVVILMQENRSFDHYFGTLNGVRGFGDRFTIPLPEGRQVWQQARNDKGEQLMPFHLDGSKGNAQRAHGAPHTWVDSHKAWGDGRLQEWPRYKTAASMAYMKAEEVPFQFALANAFTLCDAYHCAMHAGTHANRIFHWTGTNGPTGEGAGVSAFVNNVDAWADTGPSTSGFNWKTYPERLQAAGVSWKVYQNIPNNFGCNPLVGFTPYRGANEQSKRPVDTARGFAENPAYDSAEDAANPLCKGTANTLPAESREAFDSGRFIESFAQDVKQGRLPQVSWIIPPDLYSEHPGPSSPVQGAWYISAILDALTAAPEVWSKTVFLVNFDENDGYFDHMPSPSAPSPRGDGSFAGKTTLGTAEMAAEYYTQPPVPGLPAAQPPADGKVFGPGMRVPMYVISPWSRGGWVNSQVFDHTSVLRFLEARFGVAEPNIPPYRRAVCGDLTSCFDFAMPTRKAPVLSGARSKAQADALRLSQQGLPGIKPPHAQTTPRQARGTRPSRALPYELTVNAAVEASALRLDFINTGTQAAVFHVYDKYRLDALPQRYMVEAGKQLSDAWAPREDGAYDLWVLGPNGFHRHFIGTLGAPAQAQLSASLSYDKPGRRIELLLRNDADEARHFTLTPNAYGQGSRNVTVAAKTQERISWSVAESGLWYDLSIGIGGLAGFARRFAGRMETGADSVSDPAA
ncbi:MAG: phospholipase C, phosphocholine-specific [Paucibacter sp.]|nr:phospholipase C, phosphocholine-specific [Roseateles sp.]